MLLDLGRPVRGAAAKWEMDPVKWMFTGDSDVDADTQIMLELRSDLMETCKGVEKVIAISSGGRIAEPFKALCDQATSLCKDMKDRFSGLSGSITPVSLCAGSKH